MLSQAMREVDSKSLNRTTTANGAPTFKSTLNANLDFYGHSGNINYPDLLSAFESAFQEDADLALRNVLKMRDVRSGHGVRENYRKVLAHLAKNHISVILESNILQKTVELGRWDDIYPLLRLEMPSIQRKIVKIVATELAKGAQNSLVAKWLPLNSRNSFDQAFMSQLRAYMKLTPKELRKLVVDQRKELVEVKMSDRQFTSINYAHVPSRAMAVYRKAFRKHDPEGMAVFLEKAVNGEVKVNSATLYPHEVLRPLRYNLNGNQEDIKLAEAQWKNLPDFISGDMRILPMVDVSGSMTTVAYGNNSCMDISIALGLYIAERNKSFFKDLFLTFDSVPKFVNLAPYTGLAKRVEHTERAPWGGSTNLVGAFEEILKLAVKNSATPDEMPTHLIVLTDMQYDHRGDEMLMSKVKSMFKKAGYEMPKIIWWNLSSRYGNRTPVTMDKNGTALISGSSPSLLESVLNEDLESYTPMNVMLKDLGQDRYSVTYKGAKNG